MKETKLEQEVITSLTHLFGTAVFNGRNSKHILHEIGAILIARKMFGHQGNSPHAQINRALDSHNEEYPVK